VEPAKPAVGETRPGGRSARVKAAVLSAVLQELLDGGYASLRIDAVARRAEVHKTTIYRRWPTREGLVADALAAQAQGAISVPDTGTLRADLTQLARAVTQNIQSPLGGGLVRAFLSEPGHHGEIAAVAHVFWGTRFGQAGQIIHRAIARGELPPGTNPDRVLEALVGPLFMRTFLLFAPVTDAYLVAHVDFLMGALRNTPPRKPGRGPSSDELKGPSAATLIAMRPGRRLLPAFGVPGQSGDTRGRR
jgi:AcrR family transcriptional regulator